jgi:ABC-type glycerol-3-phosphate transport system permease component
MYFKIAMPLSKPAWMTLFLFAFQGIWSVSPTNGTIFSEQLKTLPSVMSSIAAGGMARAGSAMATTVIMMIPPIIVYFISQSNVMETMSSAGMKE